MKAFEKWWNDPENFVYLIGAEEARYSVPEEAAYCAWKAALEWILSEGDASYWVNEISDVIKEELKDE